MTTALPTAESVPAATPSAHATSWRRYAWVAVLPVAFVVYATSFNDYPILEEQHSVLGDADAANFALLIREFDLSRQYGNPARPSGRTNGDTAQKHKIHHTLYIVLAAPLYDVLRGVYGMIGLTPRDALYSINALVTVLNILLLGLLLRHYNPHRNPPVLFLVMYAASIGTWLFASLPESWPFSATLVLTYFLLLQSKQSAARLGAFVGVAMLANVVLGILLATLAVAPRATALTHRERLRELLVAGFASVGVWLGGLLVFSIFDPSLRPDRFIAYTFWFRDYVGAELPPYAPYVWKSILTNLFITPFVANQADPFVPQETLLYTLQDGWLGIVAVVAFLALMGFVALRAWRAFRGAPAAPDVEWTGRVDTLPLLVFCVAWVGVTLALCYCGAFMYSTAMVPLIPVIICRYIDTSHRPQAALLVGILGVLLVNNVVQILRFRSALDALL